jgi:hypothetical protein
MLRVILWISSLLMITACSVPRPDADICIVDAPRSRLVCYNLKTDYGPSGGLLHEAKPHFKELDNVGIDKATLVSATDWPRVKAYILKLKQRCEADTAN